MTMPKQDTELDEHFYVLKKQIKYILTPEQMRDFEQREEAIKTGILKWRDKSVNEARIEQAKIALSHTSYIQNSQGVISNIKYINIGDLERDLANLNKRVGK